MNGFKGFDKDMKCRGKQYHENQVFEEKEAKLCDKGMHFCENPLDVLKYYGTLNCNGERNKFAKVKTVLGAKTEKEKDKCCTTKLKIEEELSFEELVNNYFGLYGEKRYDKGEVICSGQTYFASGAEAVNVSRSMNCVFGSLHSFAHNISIGTNTKISMFGSNSKAFTSGDDTTVISCGESSRVETLGEGTSIFSSGFASEIYSAGENSCLVSTGDCSTLVSKGGGSVVVGCGRSNCAKGEIGDWIVLSEQKDGRVVCVKTGQIDGEKLKPNIFYYVKNGKFCEASK